MELQTLCAAIGSGKEGVMQFIWMVLIALTLSVFAASYFETHIWWAHEVCRHSFGLCRYQFAVGFGAVVWVGLYLTAREMTG